MKALKVPFFASAEDIIKLAKKKHGKSKKVGFAQWPDGSIRLIFNGTVNPIEEDDFK